MLCQDDDRQIIRNTRLVTFPMVSIDYSIENKMDLDYNLAFLSTFECEMFFTLIYRLK